MSFDPPTPTKATPAGCVLGLFGFISLAGSIICFWGSWKAYQLGNELLPKFLMGGIVSLLIGIALLMFGYRLALRADMRDPDSAKKPRMRF